MMNRLTGMNEALTARQSEILLWLTAFQKKEGRMASTRELGQGMGISQNAAMGYFTRLGQKGLLENRGGHWVMKRECPKCGYKE